jgi:hypothetical protein
MRPESTLSLARANRGSIVLDQVDPDSRRDTSNADSGSSRGRSVDSV